MAYIELVDSTKRYHMGGSTIMANDDGQVIVDGLDIAT